MVRPIFHKWAAAGRRSALRRLARPAVLCVIIMWGVAVVAQFGGSGSAGQSQSQSPSGSQNQDNEESKRPRPQQPAGANNPLNPFGATSGAETDATFEPPIPSDSAGVLSADQVISILQAHTDLLATVKDTVAQQLQQRGQPVSAADITDDMLYARIRTDQDLRNAISEQIIAAGYATSADAAANATTSTGGSARTPRWATAPPAEDLNRPAVSPQKNPYGNLQSLQDLYAQVPAQNRALRRFGADIFLNGNGAGDQIPIDLPVGPDYVLGPGDNLTIDLWGSSAQRLTRTIDREGRVALPEVGTVLLAGHTLQEAKGTVERAMNTQFRNVRVDLSLGRLRTVRVYVVGDVAHPGAYDLSSMSTVMNALYAAGGPTQRGSLRLVKHFRGPQLVEEVDLYDFLLHGVQNQKARLEPGDTLLVPPVGPEVAVTGMVRRPAIYELRNDADLAHVIDLAGGTLVSSALNEIKVDRIQAHQQRETVSVNVPANNTDPAAVQSALAAFKVQDGDRVMVGSILPFSASTVYLDGHVFRPGKYPYHKGMTVSDLIRSYQDLLPEPATRAEIIRLVPPDYHPEAIEFNLTDVIGGDDPIDLQPFDTVRVLGRYEADAPRVAIYGEVLRPGRYPLSASMTAADLVRMAGGFKRSAFTEDADIASYVVKNGSRILTEHHQVAIGKAVGGDHNSDVRLQPGDVVTIHQLAGWTDIGNAVTLSGEVMFPGTYGIHEGEKLSSLIRRAGGFRSTAYPEGAVLERVQVKQLAERSRQELIQRIQMSSTGAKTAVGQSAGETIAALQAMQAQQQQVLAQLKSQPASGRLVVHISSNISHWENTSSDVELRPSDTVTIPKRPNFVLIDGQVYNPSAISFEPGRSAGWYLKQAGGPTDLANKKGIFIIRANGAVVAEGGSGLFHGSVLSTRMQPGDSIVVPDRIVGGSVWLRSLLNTAQVTSSLAIAARVATSF